MDEEGGIQGSRGSSQHLHVVRCTCGSEEVRYYGNEGALGDQCAKEEGPVPCGEKSLRQRRYFYQFYYQLSIPETIVPGKEIELTITKVALGGHGFAEVDGYPVFVEGAIPGQRVLVRILKRWDRYAEARATKVLKKARGQIAPRCVHFGECGGCLWQHLPYDRQITFKEEMVRETLGHLTPLPEKQRMNLPGRVLSIIPSPQIFYYRNKLELSFGYSSMRSEMKEGRRIYFDENPSIGLHRLHQWDTVLPLSECHLYDEQISALFLEAKRLLVETKLPVYNPRTHKGVLRTLLLRRGIQTGEQMIVFFVQARKRELEPLFQTFLRFGSGPQVTSLILVEHFGLNDKPEQPRLHVLKGEPVIHERLCDLTFELSPFSFFQTNTLGAEKLYQAIAQLAELSGQEVLLDAYCGIGSIGQYLSRSCQHVVGIESHSGSVDDALRSAVQNRIGNISFYRGKTEEVLLTKLLPGGKYRFDVVVVDPPRAGLHPKVIPSLLAHAPQRIVYVSCNVAALARDLGGLIQGGYELRAVQPVDLFPHTAHVEVVALLQKA